MKVRVRHYHDGYYVVEYKKKGFFSSWQKICYWWDEVDFMGDWQPYLFKVEKNAIEFAKQVNQEWLEKHGKSQEEVKRAYDYRMRRIEQRRKKVTYL